MLRYLSVLGFVAVLLVVQDVAGQDDTADRTVSAGDLGNIIGLKPYTTTTPSRPFYMFHDIPYAKPTGGVGRFKVYYAFHIEILRGFVREK